RTHYSGQSVAALVPTIITYIHHGETQTANTVSLRQKFHCCNGPLNQKLPEIHQFLA
ncbi:hypothetical protein HAX54_035324, partial [Datura stramonium]|nr:hypothetical protein [Datura stramonium]